MFLMWIEVIVYVFACSNNLCGRGKQNYDSGVVYKPRFSWMQARKALCMGQLDFSELHLGNCLTS